MIGELPILKPDWIVIDKIDRFSRCVRDGLNIIEDLKRCGVTLYSIDWGQPLDLDCDKHWDAFTTELLAAERERRRIARRVQQAFDERKARGWTCHNRGPFGLKKDGERLVPVPEHAEIIREVDQRYIDGATLDDLLDFVQSQGVGWKSHNGIRLALSNRAYIDAGLRSVETEAKIDARKGQDRSRYGHTAKTLHPLSGVFACGECFDLGHVSLLHGNTPGKAARTYGRHGARLVCLGSRHGRHPGNIGVQEHVLELIMLDMLDRLVMDVAIFELWYARKTLDFRNSPREIRMKQLSRIERDFERLAVKRKRAGDLLAEDDDDVVKEVRQILAGYATEESALQLERRRVMDDIAALDVSAPPVGIDELRTTLAQTTSLWNEASSDEKSRLARSLVALFGSYPQVYKDQTGRFRVAARWDDVLPNELRVVRYGKGVTTKVEVRRAERRDAGAKDGVTPLHRRASA
jgi:ABC-type phosphate transport system auxiliary subunit